MRNIFKIYWLLLIFFTSIFWIACGGGDGSSSVSNTDFEASELFSLPAVDAGGLSAFSLLGENGVITVTGSPGATSVVITGTKRVESESVEDAQAHLADIDVDVEESAGGVFVETIQPQFTGGRNYIVDYAITLPSNFLVLVTNDNGNVTIDGIDNVVSVVAFNGDVTLFQINGSASVALFNGTINADVTMPLNGEIKFDVMNGSIDLAIPVNTSAQFIARSNNGSINLSVNLVLNTVLQTPNPLEGTLGAGEGTIDLEIENGDINVSGF